MALPHSTNSRKGVIPTSGIWNSSKFPGELGGVRGDSSKLPRITRCCGDYLKVGDLMRLVKCVVMINGEIQDAIKCVCIIDGMDSCCAAFVPTSMG